MITEYKNRAKRPPDSNENAEQRAATRTILDKERLLLPMWSAQEALVQAVRDSQVLVVVGETGSGKTTQIPRFLMDAGFASGGAVIACTQPRRVAATTVAARVAAELGCTLGEEVGYSVRFDDCTSPATKIKYVTDGLLLREALADPLLKRYSVVLLDEAHERTVATDVLLGLLKDVCAARGNRFRLVVMSATLDAAGFQRYFPGAGAVYVQGRQHAVDILYTAQPQPSYVDAAVNGTLQIHCDELPDGDVLVFLTGQDEIEACERLLVERAAALPPTLGRPMLLPLPIYAALPQEAQLRVFQPAPLGTRKVVLATNIAETSITIPGIKYVIDTGFVKARAYSAAVGADCLQVVPVSQAQARQRSGRAGREGPGKCFRLFTEAAFEALAPTTEPEVRRANLAQVVLQLKALGVPDPLSFDFMDPPPKATLLRALELLLALGALDSRGHLTSLGHQLSRLPVDPMYGRCLLLAGDMGCSLDVAAVVAMVSTDASVFVVPWEKKEQAAEAHTRFASLLGDHPTLLNVFMAWQGTPHSRQSSWCRDNFLNGRALRKAGDIYQQLVAQLQELGVPLASCNEDADMLRRALASGLFPHAARRQPDGTYHVLATGQQVHLHPSSTLHSRRAECILFSELVRTTRQYARCVTAVDAPWLMEVAPAYFARKQANQ